MKPSDSPVLPYPSGIFRLALRAPLTLYRLGLGDFLNIIHIMVLTTRGRKTGLPRHIPIEYRRHGSKIYLISGWGTRPHWVKNLLDNPAVTVQLGRRVQAARAQLVTDPAEALRALYQFRRVAPARYDAVLSYVIEETVNARTLPNLSSQFTIIRLDLVPGDIPLSPLRVERGRAALALAAVVALAILLIVLARFRKSQE